MTLENQSDQELREKGILTPKEAFQLGQQMELKKRRNIKNAEERALLSYQHWLWNYLEIEEVR